MDRAGEAVGVGRMWAEWGVYTGEIGDGLGTMTFRDGSYYKGTFRKL